jgi:hypothetical protein
VIEVPERDPLVTKPWYKPVPDARMATPAMNENNRDMLGDHYGKFWQGGRIVFLEW